MTPSDIQKFQIWVRERGDKFLSDVEEFIAHHENAKEAISKNSPTVAGIGIYFFRGRE
jgi:hypothetical protein